MVTPTPRQSETKKGRSDEFTENTFFFFSYFLSPMRTHVPVAWLSGVLLLRKVQNVDTSWRSSFRSLSTLQQTQSSSIGATVKAEVNFSGTSSRSHSMLYCSGCHGVSSAFFIQIAMSAVDSSQDHTIVRDNDHRGDGMIDDESWLTRTRIITAEQKRYLKVGQIFV